MNFQHKPTGVVLAGGLGTRLYPVTRVVNKTILPIYDRPMLYWPVQTLVDSGISKIIIITSPPFHKQIAKIMKYYIANRKISITIFKQNKPKGVVDAIYQCRHQLNDEAIMLIAGDNIYKNNFLKEVSLFKDGSLSFLRQVSDPERYGVPVYKKNKIIEIVEKPNNPNTNWVITGPHLYDHTIHKKISNLVKEGGGITDINLIYLKEGKLSLKKKRDFWIDAGTFKSLSIANKKISMIMEKH